MRVKVDRTSVGGRITYHEWNELQIEPNDSYCQISMLFDGYLRQRFVARGGLAEMLKHLAEHLELYEDPEFTKRCLEEENLPKDQEDNDLDLIKGLVF